MTASNESNELREKLAAAVNALPDDRLADALRSIEVLSGDRVTVIGGFSAGELRAKGLPVSVGP